LGVDGINDFGVPLVNVVVDHIKNNADLSLGICHYMSYAIHDLKSSPQEISNSISESKLSLSNYKNSAESPYLSDLTPYFEETLITIDKMRALRKEWIERTPF